VYEAESRVEMLRQEVPALLAEAMKNELTGCRPPRVQEGDHWYRPSSSMTLDMIPVGSFHHDHIFIIMIILAMEVGNDV
jgi:hypothetical protein